MEVRGKGASGSQDVDQRETNPLLGVAHALCQDPMFSIAQLTSLGVDAGALLRVAATLCETLGVNALSVGVMNGGDDCSDGEIRHNPENIDGSWQATTTRVSELSARPAIDRANETSN